MASLNDSFPSNNRIDELERESILFGMFKLYLVVKQHYKFLLIVSFIAAVITAIVLSLLDKQYKSSTTFISSSQIEEPSQGMDKEALLRAAKQFGLGVDLTASDLSALFPKLVRSRRFIDILLRREYDTQRSGRVCLMNMIVGGDTENVDMAELIETVSNDVIGLKRDTRSGVYKLVVKLPDPVAAAEVANDCIALLDSLACVLRRNATDGLIDYLNNRLLVIERKLRNEEDSLVAFISRNRDYKQSPALSLEYDRLRRNVEVVRQLYVMLSEKLEIDAIKRDNTSPVVAVIDVATVPSSPCCPNVAMGAVYVWILSLLCTVAILFVRDGIIKPSGLL